MRLVALVAAVTLLAGGCGLPEDDEPQELSAEAVPFDLLESQPQSPSTSVPSGATQSVALFFARQQLLAPVQRELPLPITPAEVVTALLEGPLEEEQELGLSSAIPTGTRLLGSRIDGTVLTVDLSAGLFDVQGDEQKLAVAEIVRTATCLPDISGVRLEVDGEPQQVQSDLGAQEGPLTPADYRSVLPEPAGCPT